MAHAWKACWVKALGGSNPPSSAKRWARDLRLCRWRALRRSARCVCQHRTASPQEPEARVGDMGDRPVKRANPSGPPTRNPAPAAPDDFAQWCRETCLALPGAAVDQPFGPDSDVFRIHRKIGLLYTSDDAD